MTGNEAKVPDDLIFLAGDTADVSSFDPDALETITRNAFLVARAFARARGYDAPAGILFAGRSDGVFGIGGSDPAGLVLGAVSGMAKSLAKEWPKARVLVAERPLVLLDEPFAALGPALKDEMLDLVKEKLRAAGKTVIIVTHDPADARRVADYAALVADGVLAAPIATDDLLDNPPPALAAYLG